MATALRLREALALSAPWRPPDLGFLAPAFFVLGTAYLALFLYLFLFYLPAQLKDLRPIGGYLGGFFRHPLLRLRHLHLAYAGLGERLLALLLFLATLAALLLYGLDAKARAALWAPPLDQGTLFTPAAQEWARSLPPPPGPRPSRGTPSSGTTPPRPGPCSGKGRPCPSPSPSWGRRSSSWPTRRPPGPARCEASSASAPTPGDQGSPPPPSAPYTLLLGGGGAPPGRGPLARLLPTPPPPSRGVPGLGLRRPPPPRPLPPPHLLPPQKARPALPAYALFLRLLLPGSLGLGGGLGVVLLLLAAYGLWALLQGSSYLYLAAAYGLHLLLVLSSRAWRRA